MRLAWTAPLALLVACESNIPLPPRQEPARAPLPTGPLQREERDDSTDAVVRSWTEEVGGDGHVAHHGVERQWYPDGTLRSERSFEHGRRTGTWRSWHPNGALRSEYQFVAGQATTMRFLHENGQPSAEGLALDGVKTGTWSYWYENGTLASQGEYSAGLREGSWSYWDEQGRLVARGEMRRDVRIGAWELHDPERKLPDD